MRRLLLASTLFASLAVIPFAASSAGCPSTAAAEGEGAEGEGGASSEGEGAAGSEGEGAAGGEGEGAAGGEGEGAAGGEGEGAAGGEGEGEGGTGTGGLGADCSAHANGDCSPGLVCGFDSSSDPLTIVCVDAPTSGSPVGTPCQNGSECASQLCEGSLCSVPCAGQSACTASQICQFASFTVNGAGTTSQICVPNGNLPATPCSTDAQCTSTNRVCDELVGTDTLTLQCSFPGTGGAVGAPCGGDQLTNVDDCATGLCDVGAAGQAGQCTQACATAGDCGGSPFVCTGSGFSNVDAQLCATSCSHDSACGGNGRSCQLRNNSVPQVHLDEVCSPNDGTQPPGTVVASSGDCTTGFAVTKNNQSICSAICRAGTDSDCTGFGTATTCGTVNFALTDTPGGPTQPVNACVVP